MSRQAHTIEQTLSTLDALSGVLGVLFRYADGKELCVRDPIPELGTVMRHVMGIADIANEDRLRCKFEHYSVIVVSGPRGIVAIAYDNGHPVGKSINRPARSVVGKPRYAHRVTDSPQLATEGGEHASGASGA